MQRQFLLDNDGSNFFHHLTDEVEACVEEAVAECPVNVTTYLLCAGAGTFYYPTRVGEVDPRAGPLLVSHRRGLDPFGLFLEALRRAGKETFVTYRMNNVHNPDAADAWNVPAIRKRHPDCIVDPEAVRAGRAQWMSYCLDYSRAEVRSYILATIGELAERYEFDGLQLDWMRFPRHLSGSPEEVWEKRELLTEFVAAARGLLRAGRQPRLLAVRVPTSADGCRFMGIDLAEWTGRDLVDFVVASPFLSTDFGMPLAALRDVMGDPAVPLYAAFDFGHAPQNHGPESLRAAATSLYGAGADGIYVFNFPCWTEYLAARPYHWLDGLHEPASAARKPLLFSVSHSWGRVGGVDLPGQVPARLAAGASVIFTLDLPEAALPAWRALLLVHSGGEIALELNGQPVPERPQLRRAELFAEYVAHEWWQEHRPKAEECRVFQPDPRRLTPGGNRLTLWNESGTDLEIRRVNLGLW